VIFGACAGLCYSTLWYFPLLIFIGAVVTVIWDTWLQQQIGKIQAKRASRKAGENVEAVEASNIESVAVEEQPQESPVEGLQRRTTQATTSELSTSEQMETVASSSALRPNEDSQARAGAAMRTDTTTHGIPVKLGIGLIATFLGMCKLSSFGIDHTDQ